MLKTLLIEDEVYIRKAIKTLIESLEKPLLIVGECGTVKEAVTVANACKPDLIFLDINLPDGDAFDFLKQTANLNFKVIFITAYKEHALEALKKGAVDYILKPVDIEELEVAINKVLSIENKFSKEKIKQISSHYYDEKLVLSLQGELQVIRFHELIYCKADKSYTTFYLTNGKKFIASNSIKEYEEQLPDFFFRTHQSYIVNLDFIDKYDRTGYVILTDKTAIPVSTRKKELFLARFF